MRQSNNTLFSAVAATAFSTMLPNPVAASDVFAEAVTEHPTETRRFIDDFRERVKNDFDQKTKGIFMRHFPEEMDAIRGECNVVFGDSIPFDVQRKFLTTLQDRLGGQKLYEGPEIPFSSIQGSLESHPDLMSKMIWLEKTGGFPNLVEITETEFIFAEVSEKSPRVCDLTYDEAFEMTKGRGVEMMDEAMYERLQEKIILDGSGTFSFLLKKEDSSFATFAGRLSPRFDSVIFYNRVFPDYRSFTSGWRGVLRIPRTKNP